MLKLLGYEACQQTAEWKFPVTLIKIYQFLQHTKVEYSIANVFARSKSAN